MNEVGAIGSFFSSLFLFPIIHIFMITFYGVYLFRLNWKLAIAGTVFIPICVMIFPMFNRRIEKLTDEGINSSGNLTGYLQEVFTGISDIRASQTYFFEQFRHKKRLQELAGINVNSAKTAGGVEALTMTVRQLGPLALYFYGGILCLNSEMAVGTLVASIVAINNLYGPAKYIVNFFTEWRQASVRFEKLDEYLRLESETNIFPSDKREKIIAGDIKFDKVRFGFAEDQPLLNDISFATEHGEKVAFVGPSGSGKSLTATLLGTIYKPLSGNISIDSQSTESISLYDLRTQIGYVNQTPFLFDDTIKNNILYGLLRNPGGNADDVKSWVDFSLIGNINKNELDQRIVDIIREVGLFEDIIAIGLRSRPALDNGSISESDKTKVLNVRNEIAEQIMHYNEDYIEFYREDRFLEYRSILENIVFCPSDVIRERFGSTRQFCKAYLINYFREKGLLEDLFAMGVKLVRADSVLLGGLSRDKSPLFGFFDSDQKMYDRMKLNERLTTLGVDIHTRIEKVEASFTEEIIDLALNHCPGKSKEYILDDRTKNKILDLRKDRKRYLPKELDGTIAFFDRSSFNKSLSLMENMIFGTINPLRKKANEDVNTLMRRLIKKAALEDLIVRIGLEFNVGERGSKLSGGQRQKVVIARIMLKNPSILILDEATAALDSASQSRINKLIGERFRDKTVISIAHRLNTIKDYNQIFVFDRGSIVEQGTFEDLIKKDGLFARLYQGSN